LASACLQEAFTRASWFIENERLTAEFLTAEGDGKNDEAGSLIKLE
jgi:hypothetical protein